MKYTKSRLANCEIHTFPSILRLEEDLGVRTDELELAVPNLEDIDEYPEVREVGPEVGSPSVLLKMGGKETGWPAWIPDLNPIELLTLDGGEPDLLLALLKLALKNKKKTYLCISLFKCILE